MEDSAAPEAAPSPPPASSAPGSPASGSTAPSSIGERLRAGRERAGLSVAAAAEKLHLDSKVIEALESNRFAELGASVYVRGHLRRYGDFVGEPGAELVSVYSAREARPPPPDLTRVPHPERRSDPRRLITPLVGLGCALVLALAIWWVLAGSHSRTGAVLSSETRSGSPAVVPATAANSAGESAATLVADAAPQARPAVTLVKGSAAPPAVDTINERRDAGADSAPVRPTRLKLELTGESWVEVYDSRGERLFYDVASAGSVQSIEGRPPLRVVLGNAAGVSVLVDGQARDIPANAVNGEGARFVVNRSGTLARSR